MSAYDPTADTKLLIGLVRELRGVANDEGAAGGFRGGAPDAEDDPNDAHGRANDLEAKIEALVWRIAGRGDF